MSKKDRDRQIELGSSLCGKFVRFYHERDGGPVHDVVDMAADGLVELHDMAGWFGPHLFVIADDVGGIPAPRHDEAELPRIPDHAPRRGTRWRHVTSGEQYGVMGVGYKESDLSIQVVYTRAQTVWIRPLGNFLERFRPDPPRIVGSRPSPSPRRRKENSMRSKAEIEIETAEGILTAMALDIERLEHFWAPSKRGSNAQRLLDSIKAKRETAAQCAREAHEAIVQTSAPPKGAE